MIVKDHEKKACGFISVTRITVRAHVSALPGPHGGSAMVYTGGPREATGGMRTPLRASRLPQRKEEAGRRHGGPIMLNNGMLGPCANTGQCRRPRLAVVDLLATRRGARAGHGGRSPGWKGIPVGRYYGG
jgi:hypothetical protein